MNSSERWLAVPGYEGHYEVSDLGRVRSLDRHVAHATSGSQFVRGRIMSPGLDSHGYPRVVLRAHGVKHLWAVHRAVLCAFMPRADWQQMHVNHKDGVTHNNRLANLEWCTPSENRLHSYRVLKTPNPQLGRCGAQHHLSLPVVGVRISDGIRKEYTATSEAVADGFKASDINACARGAQRSHRGWMWFRPDSAPEAPAYLPSWAKGAESAQAKAVVCTRPDGTDMTYACAADAAADGFTAVGISHCVTGRQASHRGCRWRFA